RHTRFSRDWSSDVCSSDLRRQVQSIFLSSYRRLIVPVCVLCPLFFMSLSYILVVLICKNHGFNCPVLVRCYCARFIIFQEPCKPKFHQTRVSFCSLSLIILSCLRSYAVKSHLQN